MKKLIEVEIYGQTFTVTSEDEVAYVQSLAGYVDRFMRQVGGSTKATVPLRVAIMAALAIADEYHKALSREEENRQEAEQIAAKMLRKLEHSEQGEFSYDPERVNGSLAPPPSVDALRNDKKKDNFSPA